MYALPLCRFMFEYPPLPVVIFDALLSITFCSRCLGCYPTFDWPLIPDQCFVLRNAVSPIPLPAAVAHISVTGILPRMALLCGGDRVPICPIRSGARFYEKTCVTQWHDNENSVVISSTSTSLQHCRCRTTDITTHQLPLARLSIEGGHTCRQPPSTSENKSTVEHREVTVNSSITVTPLSLCICFTIVLHI